METSLEMGAGGMPSGRGRRAPPGGHCTASVVVQSLSCARLFINPWLQPGFLVLHYLLEFAQTHVHWVGDTIQPSHPKSSPSPPAFNLSRIKVFSNESVLHIRRPKYWSLNYSISPFSEYSGLISFKMDLLSKGLSRVFSSTTVRRQQFFGALPTLWSSSHHHTWLLERP